MKKLFIVLAVTVTTPILAQASNYVCASMPHAEEAVVESINLDPADGSAVAVQGEDEYLNGGQYVFRKILVKVNDAHSANVRKYVVSYTIIKSFDGPDNGDYCDLTAVESARAVCERDPKLKLCQ